MKNKKGFLLAEETLKIVIAVICLGFLVYFLTSLYFKNQDNEKLELAKASLEHLVKEIEAKSPTVEIYNPKEWWITSWPNTASTWKTRIPPKITKTGLPKTCENLGWNKCICICKKNFQDDCDSNGYCLENKGIEIIGKSLEIDKSPTTLNINGNTLSK